MLSTRWCAACALGCKSSFPVAHGRHFSSSEAGCHVTYLAQKVVLHQYRYMACNGPKQAHYSSFLLGSRSFVKVCLGTTVQDGSYLRFPLALGMTELYSKSQPKTLTLRHSKSFSRSLGMTLCSLLRYTVQDYKDMLRTHWENNADVTIATSSVGWQQAPHRGVTRVDPETGASCLGRNLHDWAQEVPQQFRRIGTHHQVGGHTAPGTSGSGPQA